MTTNVTIFPVSAPAVVYMQDGSSFTVQPQETKSIQMIDGGIMTISDTNLVGQPPVTGQKFAEAMIAFWQALAKEFKEAVQDPTATPH